MTTPNGAPTGTPVRRSIAGAYLADPRHGPLPALLLVLTLATGIIDAVSILSLGRVFVANMTGNIVFTGFALAGAPGFSLAAALSALAGFLLGAFAGGGAINRFAENRGQLLRNTVAVQFVLMVVVLVGVAGTGTPLSGGVRDTAAGLAAVTLGLQNAVVRHLAVPDLTTTVLTMTLTGIGADVRQRNGTVVLRRVLAVLAMFAGATVGAILVLHASTVAALAAATALVGVVAVGAGLSARHPAPWQARRPG